MIKIKIRLIDVDGHNFPNIPLMKISAYHKKNGDDVGWYNPLIDWQAPPDKVFMSKVFTFTPDYQYPVNGKEIIKGGTGYNYPSGGEKLSEEIEHIYPDYKLYPQFKNTAYGFLTRGCPRGCDFCIVKDKEGRKSVKVADLNEFWDGQKNIVLLDPNMFACKDWKDLSRQLINSKAWVDFSQGCDIRIMGAEKAEYLKQIKVKQVHFAWDRYEDKNIIIPKFKELKEILGWDKRKLPVYVLTNFNTTFEQDLERVYLLKDLGYWPYVMIYNKQNTKPSDLVRKLQRWVNNRTIFESCKSFEEYNKKGE
ncbi:radical SAM protein [Blautia faecis]|uniref:radical SAM protein n=1 Tax=Blautia faecis TaxID=871665 RepID=UPI0028A56B72|nr:radical SAM protein [Blautia faecis]MDT4368248.1 radical SAM protein [Blautia faecis]